ncbi:MAG: hypothetical protein K1W06_10930 [Lachnospiraceae bacterium]
MYILKGKLKFLQLFLIQQAKKKIAEITGAECDDGWLSGSTRESAIND